MTTTTADATALRLRRLDEQVLDCLDDLRVYAGRAESYAHLSNVAPLAGIALRAFGDAGTDVPAMRAAADDVVRGAAAAHEVRDQARLRPVREPRTATAVGEKALKAAAALDEEQSYDEAAARVAALRQQIAAGQVDLDQLAARHTHAAGLPWPSTADGLRGVVDTMRVGAALLAALWPRDRGIYGAAVASVLDAAGRAQVALGHAQQARDALRYEPISLGGSVQ